MSYFMVRTEADISTARIEALLRHALADAATDAVQCAGIAPELAEDVKRVQALYESGHWVSGDQERGDIEVALFDRFAEVVQ